MSSSTNRLVGTGFAYPYRRLQPRPVVLFGFVCGVFCGVFFFGGGGGGMCFCVGVFYY